MNLTEKMTCNNCGGRMFLGQINGSTTVCHGPGGNGPGCGMTHEWRFVRPDVIPDVKRDVAP